MKRRRSRQQEFDFKQHGGKRVGAGRKPAGDRARMPHDTRRPVPSRCPTHVTVRLRGGLPFLRRVRERVVLLRALQRGKERFGFRLVHFSIQGNHLHLIVEVKGREALSRGMKGLQVRMARALNKLWGRKGGVFDDRYHAHVLKTPREVRHALVYVLHNAKKHVRMGLRKHLDEFSSSRVFDGWKETVDGALEAIQQAVARAHTWLLTTGWRRTGLLSIKEHPALE